VSRVPPEQHVERAREDQRASASTSVPDLPPRLDNDDDPGVRPDRRSPRSQRWVTVVAFVIAVGLVLMIVFLHLSGALGPGVH
jgi:hypothetical protein